MEPHWSWIVASQDGYCYNSIPLELIMTHENLVIFRMDDYIDEVRDKMLLPGVVSRKQQVVPAIAAAIENL